MVRDCFSNPNLIHFCLHLAPSSSPEYFSGLTVGPRGISLTWDPPLLHHQNGVIREYLINISEPLFGYYDQLSTNQTQITLANLRPNRTYTCAITAVTTAPGPYTEPITVSTDSDGKIVS